MALEINYLRNLLNDALGAINTLSAELDISEFKEIESNKVEMTNMEAKDADGNDITLKRIDWAYYHKLVDLDLAEIARQEEIVRKEEEAKKAALEEERKAKEKIDHEAKIKEIAEQAVEAGNDPEEVKAEPDKLLEQTKIVAEEVGKMQRGEEYDKEVIDEAQRMINEDEKNHPEGATIFGG